MAIAEIHGKIPYDYYEDILTADVFAAFRYLLADAGIIGFLRSIPGLDAKIPPPDENSSCEIFFWPLGGLCGREPDLLLQLAIKGQVFHVVIEAKYLSGPSDVDEYRKEIDGECVTWGNQLADEGRDLLHGVYAVERGLAGYRQIILESEPHNRFLLYLTAHVMPPKDDIQSALQQYSELSDRLFWSTWYQVHDYLLTVQGRLNVFPYNRIVSDLCALLEKKRLSSFQGFSDLCNMDPDMADGSFWRLFDTQVDLQPTPKGGSFWELFDFRAKVPLESGCGSFWREG